MRRLALDSGLGRTGPVRVSRAVAAAACAVLALGALLPGRLDAAAGAQEVDAWAAPSAGIAGSETSSACSVEARTFASPRIVPLDGYVNIKYSLRFRCHPRPRPYHLSLVLDGPSLASNRPGAWAGGEIAELPEELALDQNRLAKVGVTGSGNIAGCELTNDKEKLTECLAQVRPRGVAVPDGEEIGSTLPEAIQGAARALATARAEVDRRRFAHPAETLLVAAEAPENLDCPGGTRCRGPEACRAIESAADEAVGLGVEVAVVCLSGDCENSCLSDIATSGSYYTRQSWESAAARLEDTAWSTEVRIASVSIRDILGSNMELNPESIDPPEGSHYRVSDLSLEWRDYDVRGRESVLFAYATTPIRPGQIQVSAFGTGSFVDTVGSTGKFSLTAADITAAERVLQIFAPRLYGPRGRELP